MSVTQQAEVGLAGSVESCFQITYPVWASSVICKVTSVMNTGLKYYVFQSTTYYGSITACIEIRHCRTKLLGRRNSSWSVYVSERNLCLGRVGNSGSLIGSLRWKQCRILWPAVHRCISLHKYITESFEMYKLNM